MKDLEDPAVQCRWLAVSVQRVVLKSEDSSSGEAACACRERGGGRERERKRKRKRERRRQREGSEVGTDAGLSHLQDSGEIDDSPDNGCNATEAIETDYMGSWPIRKRPPPWDPPRTLSIGLR